jgi:proteasome lid subunit RPN8/RPN11
MDWKSYRQPELRFDAVAWLKLQWFCHAGNTEIGGFGISGDPADLLRVTDFVTVKQRTTSASVDFDDDAVADFVDDCVVNAKLHPSQILRIWCHTHPGSSPHPSSTDERTFRDAFGRMDWAVMFIVSRTAQTYARLRLASGINASTEIPVVVDWSRLRNLSGERLAAAISRWEREFEHNVIPCHWPSAGAAKILTADALLGVANSTLAPKPPPDGPDAAWREAIAKLPAATAEAGPAAFSDDDEDWDDDAGESHWAAFEAEQLALEQEWEDYYEQQDALANRENFDRRIADTARGGSASPGG